MHELARLEHQQLAQEGMMKQKQAMAQYQPSNPRKSSDGRQQSQTQQPVSSTSKQSKGSSRRAEQPNTHSQAVQQPRSQSYQRRADGGRDSAGQPQAYLQNQNMNPNAAAEPQDEPDQEPADGAAAAFNSLVCQVAQGQPAPGGPAPAPPRENHQAPDPSGLDAEGQQREWLIGPQRNNDVGRKTLVLDLDETLVHSQFKPVEGADIELPVEIEGQICQIYILVRPGVSEFLRRMAKHYEMVVFTASLSKYAEPLVAKLDPDGFCAYKLFREHCTFYNNNAFVKDLTRLGRRMQDVIIVDNSPIAFLFQPENAIPCTSWYDDMRDTELDRIATLLERMAFEDDVRRIIRKVIKNNALDERAIDFYLQTHKRDYSQKQVESRRHAQDVVANSGKNEADRGKKVGRAGHQRYESADNKSKHQAIISEKRRRQNGETDEFSMNDQNLEQMLKKMQVKSNNFVDSNQPQVAQIRHENMRQGQIAQMQPSAVPYSSNADGSTRKSKRPHEQQNFHQIQYQQRESVDEMNNVLQNPSNQANLNSAQLQEQTRTNRHAQQRQESSTDKSEMMHHQNKHMAVQRDQPDSRDLRAQPGIQPRDLQKPSMRDPQRQSRDRERANGSKKYAKGAAQDNQIHHKDSRGHHQNPQYAHQQLSQNPQMFNHPQTTKGNLSQTQQFNFENSGNNERENHRGGQDAMLASNPSPNAKRSTSVKNASQIQILKEQAMLAQQQLSKQQSSSQRNRGYSAQNQQNVQNHLNSGSMKGKQALGLSGPAAPGAGNPGAQQNTFAGSTRAGSGQRKKGQAPTNLIRHSQKLANQTYKPQSHNRQGSAQGAGSQHNASQRAQSSGNHTKNPSGQFTILSQSQRINMQNYNQSLKMNNMSANQAQNQQKDAGTAGQKGSRSSQNNQNVSLIVKRSIKDFQDMVKMTQVENRGAGGPSLNQGHQQHDNGLSMQAQPVSSTKAMKMHGSSYNANVSAGAAMGPGAMNPAYGHQYSNATGQRSSRDDVSFLHKLSNQQANDPQSQAYQSAQANAQYQGPPMALPRGYHGIGLGGGVGTHVPYSGAISLNSPKYGQGMSIPGQDTHGPGHPLAGLYAVENSNSQFNRTGPIILNNRPTIADPSMQMNPHAAVGPISTKSSHAGERGERVEWDKRSGQYVRNGSKDAARHHGSKGGSSRGPSSGQRHPPTSHSQQMVGPAHLGGGTSGPDKGAINMKMSKKQHSTTIDSQGGDQRERIMTNPRASLQHPNAQAMYQQPHKAPKPKGQRQHSATNRT